MNVEMWRCENMEMNRGAKFGFTQRHKEKSRHKNLNQLAPFCIADPCALIFLCAFV